MLQVAKPQKQNKMSAAIGRLGFRALWLSNAAQSEFFMLCNQVRRHCGLPEFAWGTFDKGWQYRVVLHEDYHTARGEFYNICYGWW